MIFAYNNAHKTERLIRALNYNCDFFVHVDKKTDIASFQSRLGDLYNVHFCTSRYIVNWGGWSQVQAILQMLEDAIQFSNEYSHIILITETDYPIWSNKKIEDYLTANKSTEFVLAYDCTTSPVKTDRNRIKQVWWYDWPEWPPIVRKCVRRICNRTIFACIRKPDTCILNGNKVDVYFGQMLFAVTPKCAEHILNVYRNDVAFNRYMKTTFASCELYYQTIVFNSPFRGDTIQKGKEHKITKNFSWAPLHQYDYSDKIKIYTDKDFEMLKNSGYPFFRKAVNGVSDELMDAIDAYRNEQQKEGN